jgi:hypothetical protein
MLRRTTVKNRLLVSQYILQQNNLELVQLFHPTLWVKGRSNEPIWAVRVTFYNVFSRAELV